MLISNETLGFSASIVDTLVLPYGLAAVLFLHLLIADGAEWRSMEEHLNLCGPQQLYAGAAQLTWLTRIATRIDGQIWLQ